MLITQVSIKKQCPKAQELNSCVSDARFIQKAHLMSQTCETWSLLGKETCRLLPVDLIFCVARSLADLPLEQITGMVSYPKQSNSFCHSRVTRTVKSTNQNLNLTCVPGAKRGKCLKQLTIGQWCCVCAFIGWKKWRGVSWPITLRAWQCEIKAITTLSRKLIALEYSSHKMGRMENDWGKKLLLER